MIGSCDPARLLKCTVRRRFRMRLFRFFGIEVDLRGIGAVRIGAEKLEQLGSVRQMAIQRWRGTDGRAIIGCSMNAP